MTLDDRIQGLRLRVMARAQVLGSVSAACREAGVSRTLYYRWRRRVERYGPDGLHPRRRQARPGRPSQVPPEVERQVVAWALAWPTWGCGRLAAQLARLGAVRVSPSTVQRVLRRAGWTLRRVLTDGGSEFKAEFDQACGELGIRHTRTKPRHAWTNGFGERLQQTILTEHWRIQFRRRYFTRLAQLETALQGFLRFYNGDRPHQGYRLRGATPASIFWGAVPPAE